MTIIDVFLLLKMKKNNTELEKLIPNENSEYTNKRINKTNLSYIKITSFNNSRYIFVSLESKNQTMIEMVSQIVNKTKSLVFPIEFDNNIRVFSIKNDNENINIKVQIEHSYFSNYLDLKFTAISGKGYITDKLVFNRNKYIIDSNDNNLYFSFHSYKCNTYDKIYIFLFIATNAILMIRKMHANIMFINWKKNLFFIFPIHLVRKKMMQMKK